MAVAFVTASSCFHFQSALQRVFKSATLDKTLRQFCTVTGAFQTQQGERFRAQLHQIATTPKVRSSRRQATTSRSYSKIINGKAIAAEIQKEVKAEIESITKQRGRPPSLSVVLVGEDPASHVYVRNKIKVATLTGIQSEEIKLPESVSQLDLLATVQSLNNRPDVDAILVQLPLPAHIDERRVCDAVTQHKDVDGFHVVHLGQLLCDTDTLLPCTPAAVLEILHRTGIKTSGKRVTVVGRSKHVCLPLAIILQADGSKLPSGGDATVTICHRYTSSRLLSECTRSADIIISGTGVPSLITGDMVEEGAVVIDVGFSRLYNADTGKSQLVGDVHFQEVAEKASLITPVPGGVGPVTVAMLMKNTLRLAQQNIIPYSSAIPKT